MVQFVGTQPLSVFFLNFLSIICMICFYMLLDEYIRSFLMMFQAVKLWRLCFEYAKICTPPPTFQKTPYMTWVVCCFKSTCGFLEKKSMAGSPGVGELLLGPRRGQWKGGVAFKWRSTTGGAVGDQLDAWWFETRGCRHHSDVKQGTGNLFYFFGGRKGFRIIKQNKNNSFFSTWVQNSCSYSDCRGDDQTLARHRRPWNPVTDCTLGAAIWGIFDVGMLTWYFRSFLSESVASHFDHSHTWSVSSFRHFKILRYFFLWGCQSWLQDSTLSLGISWSNSVMLGGRTLELGMCFPTKWGIFQNTTFGSNLFLPERDC